METWEVRVTVLIPKTEDVPDDEAAIDNIGDRLSSYYWTGSVKLVTHA
jgi:hypothetical protein